MKTYEREALLERVERESATIGASMPKRITLEEEPVALEERVLRLQRLDSLSKEDRAERDNLLVALRGKRLELVEQLEEEPMDRDTGETLVEQVIGIDRARAALRSVGSDTDIEEEIRKQRVADAERWRSFVKRTSRDLDRSLDR